jgi:hypothetical protein
VRSRVLLLGGQTIVLGLTMAFLVVPASALFLDQYGAKALPYVYLAVAASGVAVSSAMSRAQRRHSLARVAVSVVGTYLVAIVAGWLVLVTVDGLWVTFPLLVLFPLSIPIGFVLVGTQAGRLLDVRQMKAHFPRIAAGFSVGFGLGGLAAALLVSPLGGPRNLLAVDVLAAGLMLVLVVATSRRFPAELLDRPVRSDQGVPSPATAIRPSTWRSLLANRMVALILSYQLLSAAVTLLLDYMVWERAADHFADPIALTQFQGLFGAVMNFVSVLFVVTLGGWLLTRFGIGFGLAANPLGVLVLLCATTLAGYAVGPASLLFFGLVCAQAVTDISLTDATTRTSINATYQALQPDERVRAQTMVEGAGVPIALGFVGVLLIAFDQVGLDITAVVVVTLLLTAIWLGSAGLAFREYGVNLRGVLVRRAWDPVALRIDDPASYAAVDQLLASSDPQDVHAALDALIDTGRDVSDHVLALLTDPEPPRRYLGLEIAVATGQLRVPAIATRVQRMLDDPDPDVALSAAASLVRLDKGQRQAGRSAWLAAVATEDAATVSRALRAAGAFPHRFFVPYLVGLASSGIAAGDVLDALGANCDHLAPLVQGLISDQSVPRQTRERIVHFLGMAVTHEARDLLVAHLDDDDPAIVEAAGLCLVVVGHSETPDRLDLAPRLVIVAERVDRCLQILLLLDDRFDLEPLAWALRDELATAARRVEVLLELVHESRAIGSAVSTLASAVARDRSTALEMLEVTVGRSMGGLALALVDPTLDAPTRHRMLTGHTAVESRSLGEWLRELVMDEAGYWRDPWLRACAMYALPGELPARAAVTLVSPFLDDRDRDVAETARWVTDRWVAPDRVPFDAPTSS